MASTFLKTNKQTNKQSANLPPCPQQLWELGGSHSQINGNDLYLALPFGVGCLLAFRYLILADSFNWQIKPFLVQRDS
jgi:hypothetical protein